MAGSKLPPVSDILVRAAAQPARKHSMDLWGNVLGFPETCQGHWSRQGVPSSTCKQQLVSITLSCTYLQKEDGFKAYYKWYLKSKPMKIKWMCFLPSTTALLFNRGWTRWCLWAQLRIFNDSMINFNSSYPDARLKAAEDFNNTEKSKYDWRKSPQPTSPSSPACLTFSPIYND